MRILLIRYKQTNSGTYGDFHIYNDGAHLFHCKALELAWNNNQNQISRIPAGKYMAELEYSPAFKRNLFELKGVPGRSEVKIHVANFTNQLRGCIALGMKVSDINKDKIDDVTESNLAVETFMKMTTGLKKLPITIIDFF